MKRTLFTLTLVMISLSGNSLFAQSTRNDINPNDTPKEVFDVLGKYTAILRQSETLDQCAERLVSVAGGSLVNEDGQSLRNTVQPYSLKKDFQNIQHYASPIQVKRVNKQENRSSGFGASAIRGTMYKIWIAKKEGAAGMPAPISILVPEGHPSIKEPKVVGIGSL